ncbi:MAG: lysostaphin resistance A-like protein [Pyrinomonadaceae bacterium]
MSERLRKRTAQTCQNRLRKRAASYALMENILFNETGELRSGWRAAIFLFTFLLLSSAFIFGAMQAVSLSLGEQPAISYLSLIIPFGISSILAIILGWLYGRLFEGLPYSALGFSFRGKWFLHFSAGCVLGTLTFVSAIIVALMSGGLSLSINRESAVLAIVTTLLTTIVIFAVGALSEETLFRGYLLQTFTRSNLTPIGIGLTSTLFAFAHNANPDVSSISLFNTFLAGVWFAVAYLKTRDLWFPLGIHLMWNWLQGPVFGINVSGIAEFSPDPILRTTDAGPSWLTGGSYGIEGGVACTFALILSMALIYVLPKSAPPAG